MQERPPEHQPPLPYPYDEEDEINLLDYFIVLLKHKKLIIGSVFFTGVLAVIISLLMTNIYRSEATIVPRQNENATSSSPLSALRGLGGIADENVGLVGGGSAEKFEIVLKSRHLSARVVERHKLMPHLFEEAWDPDKKEWRDDPPPTSQDAYKALMAGLSVSRQRTSEVLTIKFDHKSPEFARDMVDHYLTELSESLREETLTDALENQRFLRRQLEQTSDVLLKEKIYDMLAREIEKETFARAQKYYSFLVLDPPVVPDLDKKVKPRRSLICILSVTVAFFVAVFLAFFLEYVHNVRTREDPERLEAIRDNLKLP
jgi:uncharacterized protein involved in exopolysaccharide biosynthesis